MKLSNDVLCLIEKLDATTYNHSYRLWEMALGVEEHFKCKNDLLSTAALMHDIGKLYVPDWILNKRDGLDALEREVIDLHPYYGYRILEACGVEEVVRSIALYHHGLEPVVLSPLQVYENAEVMEMAMMLHTLDVFEAPTTDRPYRRRMSVERACACMEQEQGYHKETLKYLKLYRKDF